MGGSLDEGQDDESRREVQEAECALVQRLRAQGFKGEEYERFEAKLVRYAHKVLDPWLRSGRIFRECAGIGRPLSPSDADTSCLSWSQPDREDLASAVVGYALARFHQDALVGGGWEPSKGAIITTYFMKCVIQEFPNHFRTWQRAQRRWMRAMSAAAKELREKEPKDPAAEAAERDAVLAEFRSLEPSHQVIVALYYDEHTTAEIAAHVDKTPKAVERVLERWRSKQRRRESEGE